MSGYYTVKHRKACSEAVAFLIANGYVHAEHRAREGEDDDRGDLAGIPGLVVEVKTGKTPRWNDWLDQLDAEIRREHERVGHPPDGIVLWRPPGITEPARWLVVRRLSSEITRLRAEDDLGGVA